MGGTTQRHFDGTNVKFRNLSENAATPTTCSGVRPPRLLGAGVAGDRVDAVLARAQCLKPLESMGRIVRF